MHVVLVLAAGSAAALFSSIAPAAVGAASLTSAQAAIAFGARPWAQGADLSPDGKHLVFIAPGDGAKTVAVTMDLVTGTTTPVAAADGKTSSLSRCGWASDRRLVCTMTGIADIDATPAYWGRQVAVNVDGSHLLSLARASRDGLRVSQFDGEVIDWMSGSDGNVLMTRDVVPQRTIGSLTASSADGLGVELVDTETGRSKLVEQPIKTAGTFLSDGTGKIRIVRLDRFDGNGQLTGMTAYRYRSSPGGAWQPFSQAVANGAGLRPIAVDGAANVAYALAKNGGRDALYRVALDGSMKSTLVYADPKVDVDGIISFGRHGKVVGFSYITDRRTITYLDPEYGTLQSQLTKALPKLPLIDLVSASADERKMLVRASSDIDPGHFYLLDRDTHRMTEVLQTRPNLAAVPLAPQKAVTYTSADGTSVPAYLTLPAGSDGKHLPAIVMPHGGPASRDEWGFDWLVQFYANRGFAVLQPEFRGSTGYGDDWLSKNGYQSWRAAIGDIVAAGRWLIAQGVADPDRLAIVGWSYGGYAALQANILDPSLFKAAVAIAPVTDFGMLREESNDFTSASLRAGQMGSALIAQEGSPARHADAFRAPVLMFHGDHDLNVAIGESRAMDAALRRAGRQSRLVVYPGLDHQLDDGTVRADMLAQSNAFLRRSLNMPAD